MNEAHKNVTIEQALQFRRVLEETIKTAVIDFQTQTGLLVDKIELLRFEGTTTEPNERIAKMFRIRTWIDLRFPFMP